MSTDLTIAAERIRRGSVAAFPTETVYGLGADAWNPDAIRQVFQRKGRPPDNPLIVHIADLDMVESFATHLSDAVRKLMQTFWPGPLTLVLAKKPQVLDLITGGLDTVAVRMPDHSLALQLIRETGPLVAPSANRSGRPSPTRAEHVSQDFGDTLPVLDGGPCRLGLESTVLDVTEEPFQVLRPGHLSPARLQKACGVQVLEAGAIRPPAGHSTEPARSPGTKYSHYRPEARVRWLQAGEPPDDPDTLYLLCGEQAGAATGCDESNTKPSRAGERGGPETSAFGHENIIRYGEDYKRLARELYDRLRQADLQGYRQVAFSPLPAAGYGEPEGLAALRDRLAKAVDG